MQTFWKSPHLLFLLVFVIIFLALFSHAMNAGVYNDENMYTTAGVLIEHHSLYTDFGFAQMPYLPIFYNALFRLSGSSYHLLQGRLFSIFFAMISIALIYVITYRLTGQLFWAIVFMIMFALNHIMVKIAGYAWNVSLPVACSLAALYLFMVSVSEKRIHRLGLWGCGLLLALAVGTKLYYVTSIPAFLIALFVYPRRIPFRQRLSRLLSPLLAGIFIGLLPAMIYAIRAYRAFMFNNVEYHWLNALWRESIGYTRAMGLFSKLLYALELFCLPENAILGVIIGFMISSAYRAIKNRQLHLAQLIQHEHLLLTVLLTLLSTITVLIPTPVWDHYFAMLIPYVFVMIAVFSKIDLWQTPTRQRLLTKLLKIALIIGIICTQIWLSIDQIFAVDSWVTVSAHRTGLMIRQSLASSSAGQKIATLSPLFILEADLPIYPELATGPFFYRVGDLMSAQARKDFVSTSRHSFQDLFRTDPPRAILVGEEKDLDPALIDYAIDQHYIKINANLYGRTLYVRP
jgi:hypothetical protein